MDTILSLVTLYHWDNTLFDDMSIPDGLEREDLINNMLLELSEFELLYNDWNVLKFAIDIWSKKEVDVWSKLFATTQLTYNPIENYNRTDNFDDTEIRNLKTTVEGETETTDIDTASGGDTIKKYATGFDSETAQETEKETSELGNINNKNVNTNTTQKGTDTGNVLMKKTGTSKGNIGVTTTQQMIEQERNTVKFNVYNYIIDSFKQRFCILIY